MRAYLNVLLSLSALAALALCGCVSPSPDAAPTNLDPPEVVPLLPPHVAEPKGWAEAIVSGLLEAKQPQDMEHVCAVVAIIQQESHFNANPVVPELPRMIHKGLEQRFAPLGIAAKPTLAALLALTSPDDKQSFAERIAKLRTERDLDRLFRDLDRSYHAQHPSLYLAAAALSLVVGKGSLADLNPITTAGPMQVKVNFAKDLLSKEGLEDSEIRDYLYTQTGGVRVGAARLFAYEAKYDDMVYRLADYNAGMYSSRNAAFQGRLNDLTGQKLALDGDLQAYDSRGSVVATDAKTLQAALAFGEKNHIWAWVIRQDFGKEKTADFEGTTIWNDVNTAWSEKTGKKWVYARLPEIVLNSPKLTKPLSTSWFATHTKQHYTDCYERGKRRVAYEINPSSD